MIVQSVYRVGTETLAGSFVYGRWNTDRDHISAWVRESLGSIGTKHARIGTGTVEAYQTISFGAVATIISGSDGIKDLVEGYATPEEALAAGVAIVLSADFQ
jgi:hypothetical protein